MGAHRRGICTRAELTRATQTFRTAAHDVGFSALLCRDSGESGAETVESWPRTRVAAHEREHRGAVAVPCGWRLVFRFDNTFSRFRSKTVHLVLSRSPVRFFPPGCRVKTAMGAVGTCGARGGRARRPLTRARLPGTVMHCRLPTDPPGTCRLAPHLLPVVAPAHAAHGPAALAAVAPESLWEAEEQATCTTATPATYTIRLPYATCYATLSTLSLAPCDFWTHANARAEAGSWLLCENHWWVCEALFKPHAGSHPLLGVAYATTAFLRGALTTEEAPIAEAAERVAQLLAAVSPFVSTVRATLQARVHAHAHTHTRARAHAVRLQAGGPGGAPPYAGS